MRNQFKPFVRNLIIFLVAAFGSIFVRMCTITTTLNDPMASLPASALAWLIALLILEAGGEVLYKVFKSRFRPY